MIVSKKSKLIGEYIFMLGQFIKQLKSYGDFDLAKVVRTERLAVIHNLDNPYKFSNFLESWESWGCPQVDDENFIYFRNIFLGYDENFDLDCVDLDIEFEIAREENYERF